MLRSLIHNQTTRYASQLIDSDLETTRVFWRKKYFGATEAEASDPRPWAGVVAGREGEGGGE